MAEYIQDVDEMQPWRQSGSRNLQQEQETLCTQQQHVVECYPKCLIKILCIARL